MSTWLNISHYFEQEAQMGLLYSIGTINFIFSKMSVVLLKWNGTTLIPISLDHRDVLGSRPVLNILSRGQSVSKLHTGARKQRVAIQKGRWRTMCSLVKFHNPWLGYISFCSKKMINVKVVAPNRQTGSLPKTRYHKILLQRHKTNKENICEWCFL